ncbi:SRPBCC family protein [Chitinophagaceae bacterium MMS25-I14]
MEAQPIVMERTYNAPVSAVWSALTDKEKMKQWYFTMEDFKPEIGTEFSFTAGREGKKFLHLCCITQLVPEQKIAYTWKYDGHPGESEVTFELYAEGDRTRVKLTHKGLETFPAIEDFARHNFVEGWTYILNTGLEKYLAK